MFPTASQKIPFALLAQETDVSALEYTGTNGWWADTPIGCGLTGDGVVAVHVPLESVSISDEER
jgi:hypothetical protein